MCSGGGNKGGSTSGGRGGGFGGVADSVGGGFGMSSVAGNTAAGVGGAGYGDSGKGSSKGGGSDNSSTPKGLRSIEDMQRGLSIAGPQLSIAIDNKAMTGLSYGLQALGIMGMPAAGAIAMGVLAIRDYGRSYAERTPSEQAFAERGMGAPQRGGNDAPVSGGLSGLAKPIAQSQTLAAASASGNVGSGSAGATVIMGAEKTRTGAGAGGRAKGSAVRGFGSGGLKL